MRRLFASDRRWFLLLAALALTYAFLANLRTVTDPDLFWQLASGRWVVQHRQIASTDVFSYTAQGQPWIYPVGSELLFYAVHRIGGYVLLSWLGAVASVGTLLLLLRRGSAATAAIAIFAAPIIAGRTGPRADMFSVVLFAAFLSILWENYETGRARLWLLPLLMVAWVNLHPGFVAGLALMLAFVGLDLLDMAVARESHATSLEKLKRALPFYAGTALATLVNPWGWNVYSELIRQDRAMAVHAGSIAEWGRIPLNWIAASAILGLRNPRSTYYILLAIAVLAVWIAIWQRKLGAAILLLASIYASVEYARMSALAACVVVMVGGTLLSSSARQIESRMLAPNVRWILAAGLTGLLAIVVALRCDDIIRNRNIYVWNFGAGLGSRFPEGGAAFIEREKLPGEVFNTYNEGGYLTWRLGPARRDYLDGRALPFGSDIFQHERELLQSALDSEAWQREAAHYNINTILLPVNRFENDLGSLKYYCQSVNWRPVYLDETSAVFVRRTAQTEDLIRRFPVDCATAPLPAQTIVESRAGAFNQWANAASVLAALGRYSEALAASAKADSLNPDNAFVFWVRGNIDSNLGDGPAAERDYWKAVSLTPHESVMWFSLAHLYRQEGRRADAIQAEQRALNLSSSPQPREWLKLAVLYLETKQPQAALNALDDAVRNASPDVLAASGDRSFRYDVAAGRANAYRELGDSKRASYYDEESVRAMVPGDGAGKSD